MAALGADMTDSPDNWNSKNALEFNKFTCTVNIAMIAYCISIIKTLSIIGGKLFFSVIFIILILSFISGISVFGKAAKILENQKDETLFKYAKFHVFSLCICCFFLGVYALLDSWGV
jgi:hypothetical protein